MAYGRIFQIIINSPTGERIIIDDGDVDFSCTKDGEPEPNEAELTLWGITPATQNTIAVSGSTVSVAAGYRDEGLLTLFQGELVSAVTIKPAEVYGLSIRLYESLIPYRASVTSRAFHAGQSLADAARNIAKDMGLGCQLSKNAAALKLAKDVSGVALSRDMLSSVCKPLDAAWSIQYQSVIVTAGDALTSGSASFSPESGLLGTPRLKLHTPKRKKRKDGKPAKHKKTTYPFPPKNSRMDYSNGARRQIGTIEGVSFRSLLRGGIEVGEKAELSSPSMGQGWWLKIDKISHRFSTREKSVWESAFEGPIL